MNNDELWAYFKENSGLYHKWAILFRRSLPKWIEHEDLLQEAYLAGVKYYRKQGSTAILHFAVRRKLLSLIRHHKCESHHDTAIDTFEYNIDRLFQGDNSSSRKCDNHIGIIPQLAFGAETFNDMTDESLWEEFVKSVQWQCGVDSELTRNVVEMGAGYVAGLKKNEIKKKLDVDDSSYYYYRDLMISNVKRVVNYKQAAVPQP